MNGRRGVLARRRDEVRLAFMLLSRLPMGRIAAAPPLAQSFWAYPLVGAVVGGVTGLVLWGGLALGLPSLAAGLVGLGAALVLTGAMHEDGLADTADGFGGGDSEARKLEIMRDSRIGSYGVLALVIACGLRVALWAELAAGLEAVLTLAALGALSRAILPPLMLCLPSARADGLGHAAAAGGGALQAMMGFALAAGFALPGLRGGVVLVAVVILSALAVGVLTRRQIGGITGDVLGAAQVFAEIAALLALVIDQS